MNLCESLWIKIFFNDFQWKKDFRWKSLFVKVAYREVFVYPNESHRVIILLDF